MNTYVCTPFSALLCEYNDNFRFKQHYSQKFLQTGFFLRFILYFFTLPKACGYNISIILPRAVTSYVGINAIPRTPFAL